MGDLIPFPNANRAEEPRYSIFPTMFCAGCGRNRTVPPTAADPGPCPSCGSSMRTSCRPGANGRLDVRITNVSGFAGPIEIVQASGS